AARRILSMADVLLVYADWTLRLWVVFFLLGAFLMRQDAGVKRWPSASAVALMAVPFIWPIIYLLFDTDASERAERLVAIWPLIFIVAVSLAYLFVRRLSGMAAALPFILTATAH